MAFAVYQMFFAGERAGTLTVENTPQDELQLSNGQQSEEEPSQPVNKKIKLLVGSGVKGADLAEGGSRVIYYKNQQFTSADLKGGNKLSLAAYPFEGVQRVTWNYKKNKAIIKTDLDFYLYDFTKEAAQKLKPGMDIVSWVPFEDKVIYKYYDQESGERTLDLADPDGSNWEEIADIPYKDAKINASLRGKDICYFPWPDARVETKKICFDPLNQEERTVYQGVFGADYLWSPSGNKILASFAQERVGNKLSLAAMNDQGGELKPLNFPTTAQKCIWSKDEVYIYCAMMSGNFPESTELPNDWEEGRVTSRDTLWRIDTTNAKKERVVEIEELPNSLDAVNLFLDEDEANLFFIDRSTEGLYRVELM